MEDLAQTPREDVEHAAFLYRLGIMAAERSGAPHEDAKDCAMGFVEQMRLTARWTQWERLKWSTAWARRCAMNYARSFESRQTKLEITFCDVPDASTVAWPRQAPNASPEAAALRADVLFHVRAAIDSLGSAAKHAVDLHYLQGVTLAEVAIAMDKSPSAIAMILMRARRSMKSYLMLHGIDYDATVS